MAKAKLLVIDDDIDTQDLLIAFFKPKDYEVIVYDNAVKAFDDYKENRVTCDVIITDLNLPEMSGIEFTKKAIEHGVDIPIILVTGTKTVETAVEAIEAGAYDFVVKPIPFPQLLVSVERALHLKRIKRENSTLKIAVQIKEGATINGIIGKSTQFLRVLDLAKRVAPSQANVFISGESGTGKEVIAKAIHNLGPRKKMPFIALNCASIPENLLESELFGFAKGAFTGAVDKKMGLFEEAEGGTLFLDEIGDLSLMLQAKLLRVLQEKQIKRIGENKYRTIDIRILSATHKDLKKEVAEKRFRDDLFFRLNVIEIKIPPLRDRKEDIMPLCEFFLNKFAALNSTGLKKFAPQALERIHSYGWPGNVRELENAVERAVVMSATDLIQVDDLPDQSVAGSSHAPSKTGGFQFGESSIDALMTIDELVKKYIKFVLDKNEGAKEKTAQDLNIDRKTLYRKLREMDALM